MAKNDSLTYIKRYIKTFEGVEETECVNSTYYKINNLKIRVSNHSKKQTKVTNKFDVSIVQPINDTKQYIVTVRGSLAMNIMNLTQVKEFVRNYILIKQMDKFRIEDYEEDEEKTDTIKSSSIIDKLTFTDHSRLSVYIKTTFGKWYKRNLSQNARKFLRSYIIENGKSQEETNELLINLSKKVLTNPAKIYSKIELETMLTKLI